MSCRICVVCVSARVFRTSVYLAAHGFITFRIPDDDEIVHSQKSVLRKTSNTASIALDKNSILYFVQSVFCSFVRTFE